jgi:hypothetical protein
MLSQILKPVLTLEVPDNLLTMVQESMAANTQLLMRLKVNSPTPKLGKVNGGKSK